MDTNFIIIQLLDVIAWILLIVSYYTTSNKKILFFQLIATILYALHYFFLDAFSGMFICIFEILRDYLYYVTDDSEDKNIFLASIPAYIIFGSLTYKNILGLF